MPVVNQVFIGYNCFMLQLLLVDKKISNPKELVNILDNAVKEKYPVLIIAESIEQDALAPVIRNKLRGVLKVAAIKAPSFGERKSHCLDDIAILTGGSDICIVKQKLLASYICYIVSFSLSLTPIMIFKEMLWLKGSVFFIDEPTKLSESCQCYSSLSFYNSVLGNGYISEMLNQSSLKYLWYFRTFSGD